MWARRLVLLAGVTVALLLIFRRDAGDVAHLWWTSTTFGHCIVIPPLVGWLVWARRGELGRLTPVAWWPGLVLVAGGGFAWLVGEAASAAALRQIGLLGMIEGAVVTLLGPIAARGLLFPLGYAWFAIPVGEALDLPLQQVTVAMVMPLLALVGLPASVDGVMIHAGRYWFEVAEACSGTKYVLAMLALGVLVARLCFAGWRRRALFLLVCLLLPVLANGVRAAGTIYAAHLTSVEAATGYLHVVGGWLFFAAVTAGLIAASWRWFDRVPDLPAFDPAALEGPVRWRAEPVPATLALIVTAAMFPAWSAAATRPAPLPAALALPTVEGWMRAPLSTRAPWSPWHPGADHTLFGRYRDRRGNTVDVAVAVFSHQREGAELISFGTGALREGDRWLRVADLPPIAGGATMRIRAPGPVERVVATWYRVGDVETADPMRVKLATAAARLLGRDARAMVLHLSAEVAQGQSPTAAIAAIRAALGPLPRAAGLP